MRNHPLRSAPRTPPRSSIHWIWAGNPFYAISAVLVLLGLHLMGRGDGTAAGRWLLYAILEGYTALVALAGVLVVRFAKVWVDARSVLLVFVVLLAVKSAGADPVAETDPLLGSGVLAAGLVLSILLSEGVLAGCRIRIPATYRLPVYAILALLHGAPALAAHLLARSHSGSLAGLSATLVLFPWAAALVLLTFLPALRGGPRPASENPTPWQWPWFPCVPVAILAAALPLRGWLLGFAFYPAPIGTSPVGPGILSPFLLAGAVLLQAGAGRGAKGSARLAPWLALGACLASAPYPFLSPVELRFHSEVTRVLASPLFLAALGACLVQLWRWVAREPGAGPWAWTSLAFLSTLSPWETALRLPPWEALALLSILAALGAVRARRSLESLAALATVALLAARLTDAFPDPAWRNAIAHAVLAGALAIGGLHRDPFARWVRGLASLMVALAVALAIFEGTPRPFDATGASESAYLLVLVALAAGCAAWTRDLSVLVSAVVSGALTAGDLGSSWWRSLEPWLERPGAGLLLAGLASFLVGGVITVAKAVRSRGTSGSTPVPAAPTPREPPGGAAPPGPNDAASLRGVAAGEFEDELLPPGLSPAE